MVCASFAQAYYVVKLNEMPKLNADNSTLVMVYRAFDTSIAHMPLPA